MKLSPKLWNIEKALNQSFDLFEFCISLFQNFVFKNTLAIHIQKINK